MFFQEKHKVPVGVFCSYGVDVQTYGYYFIEFMKRNSSNGFQQNQTVFQSTLTNVCGLYVIFYLYKRVMGSSPVSIYRLFTRDVHHNDRLVMIYVKKLSIQNNHRFSKRCKHLFEVINRRLVF